MALPKIQEVRDLDDAAIAAEIIATKRQLFELRMQEAKGELEKPHQFKHAKHRLAQLLTIERERQLAAPAPSEPAEETADAS